MTKVAIQCSDVSPFKEGARITLNASVEDGEATGWKWTRDKQPDTEKSNSRELKVAVDTKGSWVATATLKGNGEVESAPFEVEMKDTNDGTTDDDSVPTEAQPWFDKDFALWFALACVAIGGLVLFIALHLSDGRLGLTGDEWATLDARAKVATRIVLPIVVLGVVAVLVGLWMAAVEWRGRFKKPEPSATSSDLTTATPSPTGKGTGKDAAEIIESVGKLRGATLVMIVGALLMFAAAWITQSTASPPDTPATTTTPVTPPDSPAATTTSIVGP